MNPCDVCGATKQVRRYINGTRCPSHTPARQAGHPEPPNPRDSTPPASPPRRQPVYGRATTDPLGRTIPGTNKTGFIPRRPPCPDCTSSTPKDLGHPGAHTVKREANTGP